MSSLFSELGTIFQAVASGDWFEISDALNSDAAYLFGVILVLGGGFIFMKTLQSITILDKYFERTVLVTTYLTIAFIIFIEVIRRFVFQVQAPWSTTLPPYLFLIMAWAGCAYNTKLRTHLSFAEFRMKLPRGGQMACLTLDAVLWLAFAMIVIVTSLKQTANSASNFQILLGTDNIMQWWFYAVVPVSWLILCARVMENLSEDFRNYREGKPLIKMSAIGGE
ncbi:TRAP transporter small permease subunit [Terasakiella sp. A23]|uniref:TRAP transporter small permease n=1 Tax=Terasakiella sp. FCG-A23 TaxID=3080561 RepID=UPI0029537410|nr:TRAP transporter small permease subunit [Terasakiella sp. A23]MDV7339626.1 TRAP transporter small permease subunit [Terasakiella sp. A23]